MSRRGFLGSNWGGRDDGPSHLAGLSESPAGRSLTDAELAQDSDGVALAGGTLTEARLRADADAGDTDSQDLVDALDALRRGDAVGPIMRGRLAALGFQP